MGCFWVHVGCCLHLRCEGVAISGSLRVELHELLICVAMTVGRIEGLGEMRCFFVGCTSECPGDRHRSESLAFCRVLRHQKGHRASFRKRDFFVSFLDAASVLLPGRRLTGCR